MQELREKNWKVIDELKKLESENESNKKSTHISISKGLKCIFPDINVPKVDNDLELLFKEYGEKVIQATKIKDEAVESEMCKLKEEH